MSGLSKGLGYFLLLWPAVVLALESYQVTGNRVNLRAGPGVEHKILGRVSSGDELFLIQQQPDWAQVYFITASGQKLESWIHTDYIRRKAVPVAVSDKIRVKVVATDMRCLDNQHQNGVASCLLSLTLALNGPAADMAEVQCQAEVDFGLLDGSSELMPGSGRIQIPLQGGVGEARMQLMFFPLFSSGAKHATLKAHACHVHPTT